MTPEQRQNIMKINSTSADEVLIDNVGREIIGIPGHLHTKMQVIYTLAGTLRVRVADRSYFVPPRHIALVGAGVEHELSSNNREVSLQMIYCTPSVPGPTEPFAVYNTDAFTTQNLRFITAHAGVVSSTTSPRLYAFICAFVHMLGEVAEPYRTPLRSLVVPDDERLQRVFAYIYAHIAEPLAKDDVARATGMSVRTLSRLFQTAGMRYADYVNYQRITRAVELYADGHHTLAEVAYDVGFSTPNHFNRVFRQILGTSPRALLKK